MLRILAAHATPDGDTRDPGTVVRPSSSELRICTGNGWLIPTRLQRAGGKVLETGDFLRGRPIPDGTTLG